MSSRHVPHAPGWAEIVEELRRSSAPLVGLTTTVPVEVIFAAEWRPVDLNNIFISAPNPLHHVQQAERAGFAQNSCCWNKGIFNVARELGLKRIVAVTQGDCSNTHALIEMLRDEGVETVPFSFPFGADRALLEIELRRFSTAFGVSLEKAEEQKRRLDAVRALAHRIDELTWRSALRERPVVSGLENQIWLISCSDFFGDPSEYERRARAFLDELDRRRSVSLSTDKKTVRPLRLGLLGIPPICSGLFEFVEERGAAVVYTEIPRQFAMPFETPNLVEQYARYTYPYDVFRRIEDIRREVERRRLHGAIHYLQSFCFRHPQDALLRRHLDIPILTLECDRPGPLDARSQTRIEAFLEMLHGTIPQEAKSDSS